MIARPTKAKVLVFAIFFIGIATGVLLGNFYTNRVVETPATPDRAQQAQRAQRAQRDINKFYDYLGLNQQQRDQMHKIGEETRHEFQELRQETQPRYQSIQEMSRVKIRAVLTDEQRAKYDQFRRNMDERRKKRDRDGDKKEREPAEKSEKSEKPEKDVERETQPK